MPRNVFLCSPADLGSPEGIAVDHLGRNIFWTDSQLDRIEVARLDGRQRRILFDTGLVNPRAIVVDPVRGYECVVKKHMQSFILFIWLFNELCSTQNPSDGVRLWVQVRHHGLSLGQASWTSILLEILRVCVCVKEHTTWVPLRGHANSQAQNVRPREKILSLKNGY